MRVYRTDEWLWTKHRGMVWGIAGGMAEKFQMNRDELGSEGETYLAELVMSRWGRYDPSRGMPSTFIHHKVYWHLWNYCHPRREEMLSLEGDEEDFREPPAETSWVQVLWSELGNEGRMLLRVIFEAPGTLKEELWSGPRLRVHGVRTGVVDTRKRRAVLRYLREEAGWPQEQIREAWNQVAECLA